MLSLARVERPGAPEAAERLDFPRSRRLSAAVEPWRIARQNACGEIAAGVMGERTRAQLQQWSTHPDERHSLLERRAECAWCLQDGKKRAFYALKNTGGDSATTDRSIV
jgi:hypothetical protein